MQRRDFLSWAALATASVYANPSWTQKSGLPPIGMGTWITFNVGQDQKLRLARTEVMREFFALGGGMIDSSPMYGSSEEVVGFALKKLGYPASLFSATKVWTSSVSEGAAQISTSHKLWGLKKFDLLQVHNLEGWREHLPRLFAMKKEGRVGSVGLTTSHGRRHDELEKLMREHPVDFVQLTYNLADRGVEDRLLKVAQDRGIKIIVNRPFDGGDLFTKVRGKSLPPWSSEFDCANWAQYFLKFIIAHPAVTCAIPATSKVAHMRENMGAAKGKLPDAKMRERMLRHFADL